MGLALRTPNYWMVQVSTVPQVLLFLSVVDAFDRPDLVSNALLAPILISMWGTALWTGGSVMRDDRWGGRLEIHTAAPIPYGVVVVARVAAVVLLSLLAIPVSIVTAALSYGVSISVAHPWLLIATFAVTAGAITATGIIFSSMTIISRAAITFQAAASYPFLLLGGVFVPLDLLPGWVQPIGRVVFLSWSSALIRDSLSEAPVESALQRLAVIVVLGGLGFFAGQRLLKLIIDRVRLTGELASL